MPEQIEGQYDVEKINHKTLELELNDWLANDARIMLWGPPGSGKSEAFHAAGRRAASTLKREFVEWRKLARDEKIALYESDELVKSKHLMVDLRLSQREPVDLLGLANFTKAKGCVDWDPPILMGVLSKKYCTATVLLDEINHAPPMMQLAAYQLINEKAIGELTMAEGVRIAGAGNRRCDGGAGFAMPPALCNRFDHFELTVPDVPMWTKWAFSKHKDPRVIAYMQFQPDHLIDDLQEVIRQGRVAYATPRSWAHVADRIADIPDDADNLDRVARKVASCVGKARGITFRAFIEFNCQTPIEKVLADPDMILSMSIDKRYAVMPALANVFKASPTVATLERVLEAGRRYERDFRAVLVRMFLGANRGQDTKFMTKVMRCKNRDVVGDIMDTLKMFDDWESSQD